MYQKCIVLNTEDTEAYLYLGAIYINEKQYEEAIRIYKKILEYDNENIITIYYIGRIKAELKEYTEAKIYYNNVLKLKANFEPALLDLGNIFEIENKTPKNHEKTNPIQFSFISINFSNSIF